MYGGGGGDDKRSPAAFDLMMDIDEVSCAWHACGAQVTLTRVMCAVRVCLCSAVDGQYGGSGAMHKVEEAEGSVAGQRELILTGGAKNALVAVQRYVANNVTDYERQQVRGLWLCDCVTSFSLLAGACPSPCPSPHNKPTSHELTRCLCMPVQAMDLFLGVSVPTKGSKPGAAWELLPPPPPPPPPPLTPTEAGKPPGPLTPSALASKPSTVGDEVRRRRITGGARRGGASSSKGSQAVVGAGVEETVT